LVPKEAREPAAAAAVLKEAEPVAVAEKPVAVAEKPVAVAEKPVAASSVPLPAREPVAPKSARSSRMIIPLMSLTLVAVLVFVFFSQSPPKSQSPQANEPVSAREPVKPTTPAAPNSLPAPTAVVSEQLNPTAASGVPETAPSVASGVPETAPSVASGVPETAPSAGPTVPVQTPGNTAGAVHKAVLIESVPSSARVYVIEGTKWLDRGFTPATLEVPAGASLSVILVKDGFRRRKSRVDGSDLKLVFGLLPSASGTVPAVKESAKPEPAPAPRE